eukprot:6203622-Pleurochrysis_carterae.AAC.4
MPDECEGLLRDMRGPQDWRKQDRMRVHGWQRCEVDAAKYSAIRWRGDAGGGAMRFGADVKAATVQDDSGRRRPSARGCKGIRTRICSPKC